MLKRCYKYIGASGLSVELILLLDSDLLSGQALDADLSKCELESLKRLGSIALGSGIPSSVDVLDLK